MYRIWMQGRFYKPLEKKVEDPQGELKTPKQSE
jgi:hypothetical protein